jgi:hypothetical protein
MAVDAPDAFRHPDGTLCLEGTSSLPPDFQPCCEVFAGHTATCAHDLRYEWWRKSRRWVIAIAESAGGGGIMIRYCPHCGTPLVGDQLTQAQVRVDVVSAAEKERHWGDDPPQFNEIALTGNREGLRWLAGQILRIANAEPGIHTHLDREAHAPVYDSAEDWWLTIALKEEEEA